MIKENVFGVVEVAETSLLEHSFDVLVVWALWLELQYTRDMKASTFSEPNGLHKPENYRGRCGIASLPGLSHLLWGGWARVSLDLRPELLQLELFQCDLRTQ